VWPLGRPANYVEKRAVEQLLYALLAFSKKRGCSPK
jgi:hypothetical protein